MEGDAAFPWLEGRCAARHGGERSESAKEGAEARQSAAPLPFSSLPIVSGSLPLLTSSVPPPISPPPSLCISSRFFPPLPLVYKDCLPVFLSMCFESISCSVPVALLFIFLCFLQLQALPSTSRVKGRA